MKTAKTILSTFLMVFLLGTTTSTWATNPELKCGHVINQFLADIMKVGAFVMKNGCKKGDAAAYAKGIERLNKRVARFNKKAAKIDPATCDPDAAIAINAAPLVPFPESELRGFLADAHNSGNPLPADLACNGVDDP